MSWFGSAGADTLSHHLRLNFAIPLIICVGEWMINRHHCVRSITASWLCVLPRMLSPIQIFETSRLPSQQPTQYTFVGHTFPRIVLIERLNNDGPYIVPLIDALKLNEFKVFRIRLRPSPVEQNVTDEDIYSGIETGSWPSKHAMPRSISTLWTHTRLLRRRTQKRFAISPFLSAKICVPFNILTLGSLLLTTGLIIWSIRVGDGYACVAIILMSFASSVVGWASKWTPAFDTTVPDLGKSRRPRKYFEANSLARLIHRATRRSNMQSTEGTIILYTPMRQAFVVIHCTMEIAQRLYGFNANRPIYYVQNRHAYRALRGLGAALLILSLGFLASSTWKMQTAIGGTYMLLTILWQLPGLSLKDWSYESTRLKIEEEYPKGLDDAHKEKPDNADSEKLPSFARTLWYAIRETKETEWAFRSGMIQNTQEWRLWLDEAQSNINNPVWSAVASYRRLISRRARMNIFMEDFVDDNYDKITVPEVENTSGQSRQQSPRRRSLEIELIPEW